MKYIVQHVLHIVQFRRCGILHLDTAAVDALAQAVVSPQDKALPPQAWGRSVHDVVAGLPRLSDLPTPLLTLDAGRLEANLVGFAAWASSRGLLLCPHGKTTMAPQLWRRQLEAGAWGVTVANQAQLAVARRFGVPRVMVANLMLSGLGLRWLADDLAAHPHVEVTSWVDSVESVHLMDDALAGHGSLDVLVELGAVGGRTGARGLDAAREVASAVRHASHLRLAGAAGYEGALAHDSDEESLAAVAAYLGDLVRLHESLDYDDGVRPLVTAGGSAYPDLVADGLAPLTGGDVDVVLRSGAYLTHDDGFYRQLSPFGEHPRGEAGAPRLRSAMHGWARVTSRPEPTLALFDAGKRDLPFDEGLPEAQLRRPRFADDPAEDRPVPLRATVTALNDQHGFLVVEASTDLRVGDELRLGLSHPCTAFDKWGLIPVVDDADAADPRVVDLVRTFF